MAAVLVSLSHVHGLIAHAFLLFQLIVRRSESPIKSIELQLVRVETCGCLEGYAKDREFGTARRLFFVLCHLYFWLARPDLEWRTLHSSFQCSDLPLTATEIQNIQIADGDVTRDIAIPMHMIFPRLFTCPTLITDNFKVGRLAAGQALMMEIRLENPVSEI